VGLQRSRLQRYLEAVTSATEPVCTAPPPPPLNTHTPPPPPSSPTSSPEPLGFSDHHPHNLRPRGRGRHGFHVLRLLGAQGAALGAQAGRRVCVADLQRARPAVAAGAVLRGVCRFGASGSRGGVGLGLGLGLGAGALFSGCSRSMQSRRTLKHLCLLTPLIQIAQRPDIASEIDWKTWELRE